VQADEEEEEKNAPRWNEIVVGSVEEEEGEAMKKKKAPSLAAAVQVRKHRGRPPPNHPLNYPLNPREREEIALSKIKIKWALQD
jgi:hypothetical protein